MVKAKILMGLLSLMPLACGESDDDETTATASGETTEDETSETDLTELSANEVLSGSASSISSAGTLMLTSSSLALEGETQSSSDSTCSDKGRPWDSDESAVKGAGDDDFPVDSFRCMMTIDGGTDTPIGFLNQWAFIFCALEEVNEEDLEFSATEKSYSLTINPSNAGDTCKAMTAGSIKSDDQDYAITLKTKDITSEEQGWDKQMKFESQAFDITVKFAQTASEVALQVAETKENGGSISSITIDSGAGVLLFEGAATNEAGDDLTSHRRIKVTGTIGADLDFTAVTGIQGLDFVCHTDGCTDGDGFTGAAIKGKIPDALAYSAHWYTDNTCKYGSESGCESTQAGCTGDSCSAEVVSITTTPSDTFFDFDDVNEFMTSTTTSPLCFNSVDNSAIPSNFALPDCTLEADSFE